LSRLGHSVDFPARFQLLAAMNPCPCGYLGDGTDRCHCAAARIRSYRGRISGPLLDRFDLHIEVPQLSFTDLVSEPQGSGGTELIRQATAARQRQLARGALNARLDERAVWREIRLDPTSHKLLRDAQQRWQLSARSVVRILKVARTLADFAERAEPGPDEISEALMLRRLDRPYGVDTL
jgi:magnesium chelatase family protein